MITLALIAVAACLIWLASDALAQTPPSCKSQAFFVLFYVHAIWACFLILELNFKVLK